MKKSTKAILLSAFLYPGAGHITLHAKKMGAVFITLFSIPLIFIIDAMLSTTTQVSNDIAAGHISINTQAISDAIYTQLQQSVGGHFNTLSYTLMVIWTLALIDLYRVNKATPQRQ